jgi:hypothetical protein
VTQQFVWGTACVVFADGIGYGHDGLPCSNGNNQLISFGGHVSVATCSMRILVSRPLPGMCFVVKMRVSIWD